MTADIVAVKLHDTLSAVDDLVNRFCIRHFPVLDNGRLAGVICQADLLCTSLISITRADMPREALSKITVKDAMKPATTVPPDTSLYRAASLMVEGTIECLIVTQGKTLLGIVSRTDLLRHLARH